MNGSSKEPRLTDGIAVDRSVIDPAADSLKKAADVAVPTEQSKLTQLNGGNRPPQSFDQLKAPIGAVNGGAGLKQVSNNISMANQQLYKRPSPPPQLQQQQQASAPQVAATQQQASGIQQSQQAVQQRRPPTTQQQQEVPPSANSKPINGNSTTANAGTTGTVPSKPEKIVKKRLRRVEPKPKPYDKYAWLAGHFITIIGFLIYASYYITFKSHKSYFAHVLYRVSLGGVILSYFVSVLNQFGLSSPSYFTLLTTENFHYLSLAIVWILNRSSLFKILPYFLISILQLSLFFNFKPVLKLEKAFKEVIVYNEIFLFVLLFVDTLLLRGTSGYALVIFSLFYSMKLVFSEDTKGVVYSVIIKFDGIISKQKNPKVQALWHDVKMFLLKKNEHASTYNFHVKK